jgi:hypothetical protein
MRSSGFSAGGGFATAKSAVPAQVHGALYLAAKHRHLVAKHEILKLDLLGGAILGAKAAEQSTKHHI